MDISQLAKTLRVLSADMIERAKSGHPGAALGMADLAAVLWTKFLKFDADHPDWPNRDRVIFSNGHASALLYSILYMMGTRGIKVSDLQKFRQLGSVTSGHPEFQNTPGVDFSAGPLGQGLAGAVGMALAERMMHHRYPKFINHKTYCFVGDGCLMEGISEEAISLAGLWKLNNLIVLWDDNHITIDGKTDMATQTKMRDRFISNGWQVLSCNGHDLTDIERVLTLAQSAEKPVFIDCKTIIGFGAPHKCNQSCVHGAPLGVEELSALKQNLGWKLPPFQVDKKLLRVSQKCGRRFHTVCEKWYQRIPSDFAVFNFDSLSKQYQNLKQTFLNQTENIATRQASQKVLETILPLVPNMVGGSADLGASNLTKTKVSRDITPPDYTGNYINYGVRELGMAGIANGLVAYGGLYSYTSTFFVFSDYMKPAMRLGSLMNLKQLYIFTHDSIGAGEDGPTHQPVEQLATLRAMPNITTFRPADAIEVVESYQTALNLSGPSAIILTRQKVGRVRVDVRQNLVAKGAYVIYDVPHRKRTIIATGSEVALAIQVAKKLPDTAVVSMPSWELFAGQSKSYQQKVLGNVPRIAIEALSPFGWEKWVGSDGLIIGMNQFGASAPGSVLFEHFCFTVSDIVKKIRHWELKK